MLPITRDQAAAYVRANADAIIKARARQALGLDIGAWASNVPVARRTRFNTIEANIDLNVAEAFHTAPLAI